MIKRLFVRLFLSFLILLTIGLIAYSYWAHDVRKRLAAALQNYQAAGEPILPADFQRFVENDPEDAVPMLRAAVALIAELLAEQSSNESMKQVLRFERMQFHETIAALLDGRMTQAKNPSARVPGGGAMFVRPFFQNDTLYACDFYDRFIKGFDQRSLTAFHAADTAERPEGRDSPLRLMSSITIPSLGRAARSDGDGPAAKLRRYVVHQRPRDRTCPSAPPTAADRRITLTTSFDKKSPAASNGSPA